MASPSNYLRVLQDPPLAGAVNMARDEALMTRIGTGDSPPTLRLYQWDPPTISLGYFQRYADYEALGPPAGELAVVRRLTGGGAILHDRELTYSLTLPIGHRLLAAGPNHLYELAHEAVMACMKLLGAESRPSGFTDDSGAARGPFFCFARRHALDVLIGDDKLAGSAQRRTRTAVLQHGSIILENRFAQQPTARVPLPFDEAVARLREDFVEHLSRIFAEPIRDGEWSQQELSLGETLIAKYDGDQWTRRT
jgi:lipoate-protein ligase A